MVTQGNDLCLQHRAHGSRLSKLQGFAQSSAQYISIYVCGKVVRIEDGEIFGVVGLYRHPAAGRWLKIENADGDVIFRRKRLGGTGMV